MVCRIANYLKSIGVKKGDDVTIYMPMVVELPAAMVSTLLHHATSVHIVIFLALMSVYSTLLYFNKTCMCLKQCICVDLQLACARIGAIHSVVFAGFSAESLAGRICDSKPNVILCCSSVKRGPKAISLKVRKASLLQLHAAAWPL